MKWARLLDIAKAEVRATLRSLPAQLQAQARQVPVRYLPQPDRRPECLGLEPDTLGLFVGLPLAQTDWEPGEMTAQVFLFLENLWAFAESDEGLYREEVRRTLLHELGHYLGLGETDLEDRQL